MNGTGGRDRAIHVRPAEAGDVPALVRLRLTRGFDEADARAWAERVVLAPRDDRVVHVACAGDAAGADAVGDVGDRDGADVDPVGWSAGDVLAYGVAGWFEAPPGSPAHAAPPGHYLLGTIVAPDARRRGVGTALVRSRLAWIAARASHAWYFADDDNVASIRLHAPFGFVPVTSRFWFPGLRHPDAAMTLYRAALEHRG